MSARILIVDDEPALLAGVSYALEREQFDVTTVENGNDALAALAAERYDLLILDLLLPDVSGIQVCRTVRADSAIPIIMLTAKDSEVDKLVGLEMGADDYVTKPFSALELVGRVRALLRRRELDQNEIGPVRHVGSLKIDLARHEVTIDGREGRADPIRVQGPARAGPAPGAGGLQAHDPRGAVGDEPTSSTSTRATSTSRTCAGSSRATRPTRHASSRCAAPATRCSPRSSRFTQGP